MEPAILSSCPASVPLPRSASNVTSTSAASGRARFNAEAKRAAVTRATRDVEYRPLRASTILNENPNDSLPFHWTINPYRGCEFGCRYCYARFTHDYMDLKGRDDFERKIYVKMQAEKILRETLRPGTLRGKPLAIGTATDPYQPAEKHYRVTRRILEVLARTPDLQLSITTKSPLILRDLDLLQKIAKHGPLQVNITITTLHPRLSRILEHRAPSPRRRLETLRALSAAGIETTVFCSPIVPWITDHPEDLRRVLRAARESGARMAFGNLLHLESAPRKAFMPMLHRHFPDLIASYERMYGTSNKAPELDRARIQARFEELRVQVGFPREAREFKLQPRAYEPMAGQQLAFAV